MLPFEHRCQLRVRYGETDQMGVVWHGNYILYFETARTEALRACGGSYRELEARGVMMPVVEVGVRYVKSACYDDLLTVVVRVEEPPGARMTFAYEVLDEASETLATGHTVLAFVDARTRRPCRPPPELRRLFSRG
jgi:acyl-CoA thioester hydrolase